MKSLIFFPFLLATVGVLCLFSACTGSPRVQPVEERTFDLQDIQDITISYDEETITLYNSPGSSLIIREYMSVDRPRYHANVTVHPDSIKISEGGRPLRGGGFMRYVDVYLPISYHGALCLTTTSGRIDASGPALELSALRVDSTSGAVQLRSVSAAEMTLTTTSGTIAAEELSGEALHLETKSGVIGVEHTDCGAGSLTARTTSGTLDFGGLRADTVLIETTSGAVNCRELEGDVRYTTTSGSLSVKTAVGSGSYQAEASGQMNIAYSRVTGDLSLFNRNDDIHLSLPVQLSFRFDATTRNGNISTDFQEHLSGDDKALSGVVGDAPALRIRLETRGGDIIVTR